MESQTSIAPLRGYSSITRGSLFAKSILRLLVLMLFGLGSHAFGQDPIAVQPKVVTGLLCDLGKEGWGLNYLGAVGPGGDWGGIRSWSGTTQYYWNIDVPAAGEYQLNLLASVPASASGTSMKITSERGGSFVFSLSETKGFVPTGDMRFERIALNGKLALPAGRQWIAIESSNVSRSTYVMHFRGVEIIPVGDLSYINSEAARAVAARTNMSWMRDSIYGGMFHWTSQSVDTNGNSVSFQEMVAHFDVQQFANQVAQLGLGYVLFTCGHAEPYAPAPLTVWEKLWPGHTTQRDLIMEIADALNAKGIKLCLYIPSHVVGNASGQSSADFENAHVDLLTEIGNRYGTKVMGYWFDGWIYVSKNYPGVNIERIYNSTKIGNSNRAAALSTWMLPVMTEWQDYWGGEVGNSPGPVPTSKVPDYGPAKGIPAHMLLTMESDWVMTDRSVYQVITGKTLIDYVASAARVGVPVTINMAPYADGTILPGTYAAMVGLKNTFRSTQVSGLEVFNDTHYQIRYSGSWSYSSGRAAGDYNDDLHYTTNNGDSFEFSFTGNEVDFISEKFSDMGQVDVYVDGAFQATIDCYNSTRLTNLSVFHASVAMGAHTLKAVKKSGTYMCLDAIKIRAVVVPVSGITLVPATLSVSAGSRAPLSATVLPANATNQAVTYTSSNPGVAAVDASGNVAGVSLGDCSITAKSVDGGFTAVCAAHVSPPVPRSANSVFQADEWRDKNGSVRFEAGLAPDGTSVGYIASGDWLRYSEIDFGTGALNVFMATIAVDPAASGKSFEIRLDSPAGQIIGTLTTASTGSWGRFQEQYAAISAVTGVHDVYLVFPQAPVANINWFTFGTDPNGDTPAQRSERMAWWRDARFGQFIHWGAYSQLAGVYGGRTSTNGEWIMNDLQIPKADYQAAAASNFVPAQFDAAAWMRVAKAAGQKYVVVTSKHHEGFSMFATKVQGFQPYDIKDYAGYGSDPMAALSAEAKRQGIKFCVYYSIMDWRHATQTNTYTDGTTTITDKDLYVSQMKEQLRELIQNYGVELIWFDGEWSSWWTREDGQALARYLRTLKHSLIVNNRVGKRAADDGDFGTPEQEIPASGLGYDWESCMTINGTWGYKTSDTNWKSTQELLRNLVDIASKGGNYLLNVGPTGAGVIPQASVDRLAQMGAWHTINGESIYGTGPTSIGAPSWGRSTTKADKLYLHVFDWPSAGQLVVNNVPGVVSRCALLSAPSVALPFSLVNGTLTITIPTAAPDSDDSVLVVDARMPWLHSPQAIPGKLEAEYYREGGEGVGYHDTTVLNSGGLCRSDNVDIEAKPNEGLIVGYVAPGEWLAYDVAVASTGIYDLQVRVASAVSGKTFHIELNGTNITGAIAIPNTGSWASFTTITIAGLPLQAMTGVLKIVFDDGGINLDWVSFIDRTPNSAPTISGIADQNLAAGVASAPIPFTIGDAETPASNLTLVASSDTPGLVPPANIVIGGSGASRTVTVTPAAGQPGTATIAIQVSDANGASSSSHFKVNVSAPVRGAILDGNNDGISDVWSSLYPNIGAPTADPDGDGVSNLAEAQAGTDPTNPASRFIATAGRDASGNLVVRWPSVAGKYYFVGSSTDLATWTALPGEYIGTGAELSVMVRPAGTNTSSRTFWHVVVFDVDSAGSGLNDWEKLHMDHVASITATAGPNGSISLNGQSYVGSGGSLSFAITPFSGYAIDTVTLDGTAMGAAGTYSVNNISAGNHTIAATFKAIVIPLGGIVIPEAKWWRDAKFGIFIHWGMASMYDNNLGGDLSWCRPGKRPLDIDGDPVGAEVVPSYDTLYRRFDPTAFNADNIVALAKRAGARYIVPTTKHHEGFAMWDTKQKNSRDSFIYGVMSTPWHTDYVKLLTDACHRQGMDLGFYYSPRDWYNPDYGVGDNSVYETYMKGQLTELLNNYGKVKIMWWDSFGRGDEISFWHSDMFQQLARTLQPGIMCNDRSGSFADGYSGGDFFTPEQTINPDFSFRLWESCMTMNNSWGYTASDTNWKSANELIKNLVSCTINNGNFLLNIGPKYDGSLEQEAIDRLNAIGDWTSKYGESIFGTRPWISRGSWGGTVYKGNTIYVHLTSWNGTVTISPTPLRVVSSRSLNGGTPTVRQDGSGITISLPSQNLDGIDNVIALEMDKPVIDTTPIQATATIEAERFYDQFGQLRAEACSEGGENLGYIETGNYALYKVDFGSGVGEFKARVAASANQGIIELRLDSASNPVFARLTVGQTGGYGTYATQSVAIPNGAAITGVHDLYVVFGAGCNLNWFTFAK